MDDPVDFVTHREEPNRAALLRGYLAGLAKRRVSGGLDPGEARAFAEEQLVHEEMSHAVQ